MKRGVLVLLGLVGVSAVVLPWRFGVAWLVLPALVLGALALTGVMGAYADASEPKIDPLLAEHGVKLLAVSGLLCVIGIIGGIKSCQAMHEVRPMDDLPAPQTTDYIRERARRPAPVPSDDPSGSRPAGPQLQ